MSKPYKCTKCGYNHTKGKVYEDHKQFAEKQGPAIKPDAPDVQWKDTGLAFKPGEEAKVEVKVTDDFNGKVVGTATLNGKTATVVIHDKGMKDKIVKTVSEKGGFSASYHTKWHEDGMEEWEMGHLDRFLLKNRSENDVRQVMDKVIVTKNDGTYKAIWKSATWEVLGSHARIPFTIDEMTKYVALINRANGHRTGPVSSFRAARAMKEGTNPAP